MTGQAVGPGGRRRSVGPKQLNNRSAFLLVHRLFVRGERVGIDNGDGAKKGDEFGSDCKIVV